MVSLQILNKILSEKSFNLVLKNNLDIDYFLGYENEFTFIKNHYEEYNQIPDIETFLDKFTEFEILEVQENDEYLISTIKEENLYSKSVPILKKMAEILKDDSNEAVKFLQNQLENLTIDDNIKTIDIVKNANLRLEELESRNNNDDWYITTGLEELDPIINGFSRGEDLIVLFARTGQGKSWLLGKFLSHSWQIGNKVGYISPEMTPNKIGFRFDTLTNNFSNRSLVTAKEVDIENYKNHIEDLTKKDGFFVSTPKDFKNEITINKLRNFVKMNKIDILGIDGIKYLKDERSKKGDNLTTTLTNISEDLMQLSIELKIPIIIVVQSNREGAKNEDMPDITNIKDSDGISHNATKVISLKHIFKENILKILIAKNREGRTGQKLTYNYDIDLGKFDYIPDDEDGVPPKTRERKKENIKKQFNNKNVF